MQLLPIDTTNQEHIEFTYEILCKRFNNQYINIDLVARPTKSQHKKLLNSKRYKYYYIINFNNINVGIIYITRKDNELGYFLNIPNAIVAYKKYKTSLAGMDKVVSKIDVKPKTMSYYIAKRAFDTLLDIHPDLKNITCKVNYTNQKSRRGTEFVVLFKPVYIYYEYRR